MYYIREMMANIVNALRTIKINKGVVGKYNYIVRYLCDIHEMRVIMGFSQVLAIKRTIAVKTQSH